MPKKKPKIIYSVLPEKTKNRNNEEDSLATKDVKIGHDREIKQLKHKVAKNIWRFLIFLTLPVILSIILLVYIFIVTPASDPATYETLPEWFKSATISYQYLSSVMKVLQSLVFFIVGVVISDWASSKYKK